MDRKKTILIAVMINAGLLVVLFVAALSSNDEIGSVEIAQKALTTDGSRPLFSNEADIALHQQAAPFSPPSSPSLFKSPAIEIPKAIEEVQISESVHKLPEPVVESVSERHVVQAPIPQPLPHLKHESLGLEVTVKKGDSLDKIAKAHHTTVDEIIKLNQLPGSFLKVGQVLKLPEKVSAAAPKAKSAIEKPLVAGPEYYTVKVGDNPWGIAMKHHMKVEELLKMNNLNEERARKLKPGDRLRIR
jgi:peptidoglycan endopeptidase LytF